MRPFKSLLNRQLFLCCCFFLVLALPAQGSALYVQDGAGIYSPAYVRDLETKLESYSQNEGPEIAVVTLPTLQGRTVEAVARELFDKWSIGKKGKDNGLLFLIAVNERKVRIETGYGLEMCIPDGVAGEIIRHKIAPCFANREFEKGTTQGIEAILQKISPAPQEIAENNRVDWVTIIVTLITLSLIGLFNLFIPRNNRNSWPRSPTRFPPNRPGGFGGGRGGGGGASGSF